MGWESLMPPRSRSSAWRAWKWRRGGRRTPSYCRASMSCAPRPAWAAAKIACVCRGARPGVVHRGAHRPGDCAKGIASALGGGPCGRLVAGRGGLGRVEGEPSAGQLLVVADAMRREVYPVEYRLRRQRGRSALTADRVIKAEAFAEELGATGSSDRSMADDGDAGDSRHGGNAGDPSRRGRPWSALPTEADVHPDRLITGDGLRKYAEFFESAGALLPEALWTPTGAGLLMALRAAWRAGECDPFDAARHDPAFALSSVHAPVRCRGERAGALGPHRRWPGGQARLEARDHERYGHRQRPGQRRGHRLQAAGCAPCGRCGGLGSGGDGNRCVERGARGRRAGACRPRVVGRLRCRPEDAAFRRGPAGGLRRWLGGRWRSADSEGGRRSRVAPSRHRPGSARPRGR